jgi:hypothetical protein
LGVFLLGLPGFAPLEGILPCSPGAIKQTQ